ncbi:helix-turn-helix transcriptional regulator [Burkholderia cenocepacia]|uniref:helix-turn-helix domain-containing protein n=1 Tax=Burkholderia cenocepacia TaxID=95486 RepID=UPI001CF15DFF|nr:helix-turn-helix transcriptional regulator [Burkholderia cenocepacia]MCA8407993.1 helix-turn-helix transcriptional regulator [Burkholderia cenocepacia]
MKQTKLAKLRRPSYRNGYVKAHLTQGLAFQIRALRKSRGLTQGELAKKLELGGQSAVARLEDPSYGRMSLQTLLKVGEFFDVALMAKFVPYSRFLREVEDVSEEAMTVESFAEEDQAGAIENAPEFQLIRNLNAPRPGNSIAIGGGVESTAVKRDLLTLHAPQRGMASSFTSSILIKLNTTTYFSEKADD